VTRPVHNMHAHHVKMLLAGMTCTRPVPRRRGRYDIQVGYGHVNEYVHRRPGAARDGRIILSQSQRSILIGKTALNALQPPRSIDIR
jgi:hypothetical protein